jgi:hypothetical protein
MDTSKSLLMFGESYCNQEVLGVFVYTIETKKKIKTNRKKIRMNKVRLTAKDKFCSYLSLPNTASFEDMKWQMIHNKVFYHNIENVAAFSGISSSSLKRLCREMRIKRWPARKFIADLKFR